MDLQVEEGGRQERKANVQELASWQATGSIESLKVCLLLMAKSHCSTNTSFHVAVILMQQFHCVAERCS